MVAILPGLVAPHMALSTASGDKFSLSSELAKSPLVLLAFFKVSCPVCQFAFPYIERLKQSYPSLSIVGVSQDDPDATAAFAARYGLSFKFVVDGELASTVDYGLTNVPSLFLVGRNGNIELTSVGFVKEDLEEVNERLARAAGVPSRPLFTSADEVPAVRPG